MSDTTSNPPARMGRPSEFSEEVAAQILERLSEGESLRTICADERLPHRSTIFRWLAARPDFAAAYAQAKEVGCEWVAEEALADALNATPATAQVERLRWDARRWHISKLSPRKWGDKVVNEHTGAGGGPIALQPVQRLVPEEVSEAVRKLLAEAEQAAGLAPGEGSDTERLQRVMLSGMPLHPRLWSALRTDGGGGHD